MASLKLAIRLSCFALVCTLWCTLHSLAVAQEPVRQGMLSPPAMAKPAAKNFDVPRVSSLLQPPLNLRGDSDSKSAIPSEPLPEPREVDPPPKLPGAPTPKPAKPKTTTQEPALEPTPALTPPLEPSPETFDASEDPPPPFLRDGVVDLDAMEGIEGDDLYFDGVPQQAWRPRPLNFRYNGLWVRGEYLLWTMSGMYVPPLVTTGTGPAAGALLDPNTVILFGDEKIHDNLRSGARITFGTWLNENRSFGLEGQYFGLADEWTHFSRTSTGNPVIARPFFNTNNGTHSAAHVAITALNLSGSIDVDIVSRLQGAGGWMRFAVCQGCDCAPGICDSCNSVTTGYRINLLAGYRWLRHDDRISIHETATSTNPAAAFVIDDAFHTENHFHGGDVGAMAEFRRGRWSIDLLTKVALGATHQTARINGRTQITDANGVFVGTGGILALQSPTTTPANIGTHERDVFSVVPEVGLTVGFQLTSNLRAVLGYSLIYWSRVLRAGDQISLDVNPNLFPEQVLPIAGAIRPQYRFVETDLWAQGMNVGIEGRW